MGLQNLSRRSFLELAGSSAAVLGLAGCGTYTSSSSSSSDGSASKTFTVMGTQPNTLNIIQSSSNLDSYIFYLTQEMLYRPYDGKWEPEVCESLDIDDTGTVFTYKLKSTTWSDGTAITAKDFAYCLTAQLDPNNASPNASNIINQYRIKNAGAYYSGSCDLSEVGIEAVDDSTLRITTDGVVADFDGTNITLYPLSESFVEEKGEALGGTPDDYMNSGPYVLTDWTYGSSLTLEKNDKYLDSSSKFAVQTIDYLHKTDENAALTQFQGGDLDCILSCSDSTYVQLKDSCTLYAGGDVKMLELNPYGQGDSAKAALLSNKNFRMALSYALDRSSIVPAASVLATPVNRYNVKPLVGNSDDTYFEDDYSVDAVPLSGDAEKAKSYLAAALSDLGYADVSALPALGYLTFDSGSYRSLAELIVDQWKQVLGLENVTISLEPVSDAVQDMIQKKFDIYLQSLSVGVTPSVLLNYWVTGGSVNDVMGTGENMWSNAEFDSYVSEAGTTTDRTQRMALYAKAEQVMIDDAPLIPIDTSQMATALASNVSGFMYNSIDAAIEVQDLTV